MKWIAELMKLRSMICLIFFLDRTRQKCRACHLFITRLTRHRVVLTKKNVSIKNSNLSVNSVYETNAKSGEFDIHWLKFVKLPVNFLHSTKKSQNDYSKVRWLRKENSKKKWRIFFYRVLGNALLRRLVRIGVLDESKMKLDYVLGLKVEDFLERRLQTQLLRLGLAKSIHHARVLIRQRHIR